MKNEKTYIATFTFKSKNGNGETETTELFKGRNIQEARDHAKFFKAHYLHSGYRIKCRLLK